MILLLYQTNGLIWDGMGIGNAWGRYNVKVLILLVSLTFINSKAYEFL